MNHRKGAIGGSLLGIAMVLLASTGAAAEPKSLSPYESRARSVSGNQIDRLVVATLRKRGIEPAYPCSDGVFLRRVYLDVIGTLPTLEEVRSFFQDGNTRKRALLIDSLLERDEFADYWSLKWCDLLRVKSEFPINLWPNAVQAYHRWIHNAIRENHPYNQFARELLTSSGSNFRVPPVNFYRAMQGEEPSTIARTVALTWMGVRLERWPEQRRLGMESFFSRVAFKKTAEWKEEIVQLAPDPTGPLEAIFPDGSRVTIPAGDDPRVVFADWLLTEGNPWFARTCVNRLWFWLMGHGLDPEPDDIRLDGQSLDPSASTNPDSGAGPNSKLLAYLEKKLVRSNYDLRHLYRLILNSRTYQQSSIARSDHPDTEILMACYTVRRLDAEVLIDAICSIYGGGETYSSQIPEPFTFIPEEQRTIELADGSITSGFLEMFGRPSRDTGMLSERNNKTTDSQRLHLLNSTHIQRKIERSAKLRGLIRYAKGKRRVVIQTLTLRILSRPVTERELSIANAYFQMDGMNFQQAAIDLAWALTNSKEFLYRH